MAAFPAETRLSADGLTATTDSYEPRILLSSVGFSRGVHYWEFTVDRYDGAADPAFGIARRDVARDAMLGMSPNSFFASSLLLTLFVFFLIFRNYDVMNH